MVVRENDAAPGQEAGVFFARFEELHLIDSGDLVFRAYLHGTDVDSSNDGVIYRYRAATDTLSPVVREGDEVANAAGGVGSTPKVINDNGQAVIKVTSDLSGAGAF